MNAQVNLSLRMGAHAGTYSTYIADESDHALVLAAPIIGGAYVPIVAGAPVRIEYSDASGAYRLYSNVIRVMREQSPLVVIDRRGRVEHEQRRRDVRLELSVPVRFGVTAPLGLFADTDLPIFNGRTRDVSGGGIQLVTRTALQPGVNLSLELQLPKGTVVIPGEVVRTVATIDQGTHKDHVFGVRFTGAHRNRDKLIRYIFEQQRLRLKKGLLVE